MKTYLSIFIVLLTAISLSCKSEKTDPDNRNISLVTINASAAEFSDITSNPSSETSDPFELGNIIINGSKVEVTVLYSGGCAKHAFKVIWDEAITNTNPPVINLVIIHDSNGDNCEAYITEVITFEITDLLDSCSAGDVAINAFSGFNPGDSVVYDGEILDFKFEESDICNDTVTAREVICGWGLYDNLWFALKDSVSAGIDNFFYRMYLQPVAIDQKLTGFVPVPGKKYFIGARIDNSSGNLPAKPVCMAYPGLSVPVRIICITELN